VEENKIGGWFLAKKGGDPPRFGLSGPKTIPVFIFDKSIPV
jgi:hypothetical protein